MSGAQNTNFGGISGAQTAVAAYSFLIGRMLCRAAVCALLVCGMMPQCIAAKARQHSAAGVYLTNDGQLLRALAGRTPGTYWIDGYKMTVSKETRICWHDASLQFGSVLNRAGQPIRMLDKSSPCEGDAPDIPNKLAWLQYLGREQFYYFTPLMSVAATRIDVWNDASKANENSNPHATAMADWQVLCASPSSHQLHYANENAIDVLCDPKLNNHLGELLGALLKRSTAAAFTSAAVEKVHPVYIVKPFQVRHNYDFESVYFPSDHCNLEVGPGCAYKHPRANSTVRDIVYAPDGSILIPDTVLALLDNEAQCAALLAYSLAANDQSIIDDLFQVQRFKGNVWSLSYKTSGRQNRDRFGGFIFLLDEQVLRLGIRQMYLAGYDIRYAPFAWAVEQDKQIRGPFDQPNKHMTWYATYGFNVISQLYPNVDYSKLKRGEAEYQEFLCELRKADPAAFAAKK